MPSMPARRRRISWSKEALADLADIWMYYRNVAGKQTADNIIREISVAALMLEEHPLGGRSRDALRPGLRSVSARPHIVFYRLRNETPEIVRVLDGRRDIDENFFDDA